jgi:hypothetical protein
MSKLLILYKRNRSLSQREEGLLKEQSGFLSEMILQNLTLEAVIGLKDTILYFEYSGLPHLLRELLQFLNWMENFLEHNEEGTSPLQKQIREDFALLTEGPMGWSLDTQFPQPLSLKFLQPPMMEFRLPIRKPHEKLFLSTIEECRDWLRIFALEEDKKSILDNSYRISELTVAQSAIFQAHIKAIMEEIQSGVYTSSEIRMDHVAKAVLHLLSKNAPRLPVYEVIGEQLLQSVYYEHKRLAMQMLMKMSTQFANPWIDVNYIQQNLFPTAQQALALLQEPVHEIAVAEQRIEFILERLLIDGRIGGFIENPPLPFQIVALLNQSQELRFIVLALLNLSDQRSFVIPNLTRMLTQIAFQQSHWACRILAINLFPRISDIERDSHLKMLLSSKETLVRFKVYSVLGTLPNFDNITLLRQKLVEFFEAHRQQNSGLEELSYIIAMLVKTKDIHAFTILQNYFQYLPNQSFMEILPLVVQLDPNRGHVFIQEQMKTADDQIYRDALSDSLLIISDNKDEFAILEETHSLEMFLQIVAQYNRLDQWDFLMDLTSSSDEKIRYRAIEVISSFGLTIATPRLLQIIMSQVEAISVISCAIQGLQQCGDNRAKPYLEQFVQNHEDQRLRELAQQTLILGKKLHIEPQSNDYTLRLLYKGEPWDTDSKDLIMKMFLEEGFANVMEELEKGFFISGPMKTDSIEVQLKLISKLNDLSKYISYNASLYEPLGIVRRIGTHWKLNEGRISREAGWLEIYVDTSISDATIFPDTTGTLNEEDPFADFNMDGGEISNPTPSLDDFFLDDEESTVQPNTENAVFDDDDDDDDDDLGDLSWLE